VIQGVDEFLPYQQLYLHKTPTEGVFSEARENGATMDTGAVSEQE
jgi:hypothetical protein